MPIDENNNQFVPVEIVECCQMYLKTFWLQKLLASKTLVVLAFSQVLDPNARVQTKIILK
jgi:hypothetical protein